MVVPVVPMRVMKAQLQGLEIRICKYAHPETGRWAEFVQVRRPSQSWGQAALLEYES